MTEVEETRRQEQNGTAAEVALARDAEGRPAP